MLILQVFPKNSFKFKGGKTLCKIAFECLASFPPFKRSPFPLRIANEAIYSNDKICHGLIMMRNADMYDSKKC